LEEVFPQVTTMHRRGRNAGMELKEGNFKWSIGDYASYLTISVPIPQEKFRNAKSATNIILMSNVHITFCCV
jgi:hypothetical protein